jgi:hypothetical protein
MSSDRATRIGKYWIKFVGAGLAITFDIQNNLNKPAPHAHRASQLMVNFEVYGAGLDHWSVGIKDLS